MSNTYTWIIPQLECYAQKDGFSDVVFIIHWRREITDGVHTADMYGTQPVVFNSDGNFTPYSDISFAQACQWLTDAMGPDNVSKLDAALAEQLANMIAPAVIDPPLPWDAALTP